MKIYIGRIIILVDDYDKASAFCEMLFGFKKLFDTITKDGQHFHPIGMEGEPSIGIWFLKAESPQQPQLGNLTAGQPAMVIYTSELDELYDRLSKNNVTVKVKPVRARSYSFFH